MNTHIYRINSLFFVKRWEKQVSKKIFNLTLMCFQNYV